MSDILIGNGTVVTGGAHNQLIEHGAVLVQGNRIAAIGSDVALLQQYPGAHYIDAYSGFIMPAPTLSRAAWMPLLMPSKRRGFERVLLTRFLTAMVLR